MGDPARRAPWQQGRFTGEETDPLSGFANIMDVMLVFALGLLIVVIDQSPPLREHFKLDKPVALQEGKELAAPPESLKQAVSGDNSGMESLGQVYRDPATGKLILIGRQASQQ